MTHPRNREQSKLLLFPEGMDMIVTIASVSEFACKVAMFL
jgi:hypothetical protein